MALKIESGDLFNAALEANGQGKAIILVHGCNGQGVMASGVAALVKKLYPYAYEQYKQEHTDFGLVVGDVVFATSPDSKVVVANAITQKNYGRDSSVQYVSYDAVVDSMQRVAKMARETKAPVILPMIGGGLGNGDVKRLTAIFQAVFHDVDATLFIQD
jgi:O-acetyl-ADP-ribose deacetylase (regulator of RNase III)